MVNEERLKILGQGADAWNAWRKEITRTLIRFDVDLAGANLRDLDLTRANLAGVDFTRADFIGANLAGASLSGAKLAGADFTNANLKGADLRNGILLGANLFGANLNGADLRRADLRQSNLSGTNLSEANLRNASFIVASLFRANLSGSDCGSADLRQADLAGADLTGADLSGAKLNETIFGITDLTETNGLNKCLHLGPCVVDHYTLKRSKNVPIKFWRGCGLPEALIDYLPSLLGDAIQYYSCFISYSSKDQEFADRLHVDLQNNGVRCWFAPHDLPIGEKIWDGIDQAIRTRDKVLLILSESAITSDWVEDEVTTAFAEERRRGELVLFPVRLDNAVMDSAESWARKLRDNRNIGDFTKWKEHDAYKAKLDRVLRDLKAGG